MTLPSDWRWLRRRISRVKVESCADGTMRVTPTYKKGYAWSAEKGKPRIPGLFTRMAVAHELQAKLNARLVRRRAGENQK